MKKKDNAKFISFQNKLYESEKELSFENGFEKQPITKLPSKETIFGLRIFERCEIIFFVNEQ